MRTKVTALLILCLAAAPALGLCSIPVGMKGPDFKVQALGDNGQGGDMVSLSDYAGKIVVMDLFATW